MRVACIGEAMIELSMNEAEAQVGVAGDTLNTAIYLKRAAPDIAVDYVTCLGDDPFSTKIMGFIAAQNIGCDNIRVITGKSPGLYAITTNEAGERAFTYWRNASAARQMFQVGEEYDFSILAPYDVVYLSGITMAILPQQVRLALMGWLQETGARVAYDSNYRPRLWEDATTARQITRALWSLADIALPSIDDEMALFEESAETVAARFAAGAAQGALKRGGLGPLSLGEAVDQTYAPAANVVDTTAAGDSFNGGYLGALLAGKSQQVALKAGHDCASRVVQYRGAIIPA
ncbi:2-dehydro-3-deoxygluconokinase [Roseobacter fucihabitans]|uniref:2-dehydro-3-deoxygluconokinase n=1 Tax=Roseobacter fucihabitans TaxID=1537242 RepID=A0ABZ2BPT1_9RHOB|nr:sugar kinase [Roseobacter litoralis]MBC6963653.1 2-dehydro-3-deoxygluconokinase [Roseobacter litoralis]